MNSQILVWPKISRYFSLTHYLICHNNRRREPLLLRKSSTTDRIHHQLHIHNNIQKPTQNSDTVTPTMVSHIVLDFYWGRKIYCLPFWNGNIYFHPAEDLNIFLTFLDEQATLDLWNFLQQFIQVLTNFLLCANLTQITVFPVFHELFCSTVQIIHLSHILFWACKAW